MAHDENDEVPMFLSEGVQTAPPVRQASIASAVTSNADRRRRSSVPSIAQVNNPRGPEFPRGAPYTETEIQIRESRILRPPVPGIETLHVPHSPGEENSPSFTDTRSGGTRETPQRADIPGGDDEGPNLFPGPQMGTLSRTPTVAASLPGENAMPFGGQSARNLGTIEVASFIINKMIGTGIVTGPAQVLLYTRRKDYALLLWGLGFLYTLVSVVLFVEFGYRFKVTGGELVYLDEIFRRPRLLFVTIFSFQFILFWNTSTNCAIAARQILACADRNLNTNNVFENVEKDDRITTFIAIVILVFVCLLHYFSTAAGRVSNVSLALFKIVMLLVLFGQGVRYAANHGNNADWSTDPSTEKQTWDVYANAIFAVLFAYQGWENASFVAGEVDRNSKALKRGYYLAVVLVGMLYLLVNVAFLTAFELVLNPEPGKISIKTLATDGYAARYWGTPPSAGDPNAGQVDAGPVRAWAIILTLSALGNILSVTYTCGRVKQMIGQAFIFPWSRLWARESRFNTPSGGLLLHCLCSLVLIVIGISVGQVGLPGYLQAYSHAVVAFAVTIAFCQFTPPFKDDKPTYQWAWMSKSTVRWIFIILSLCMNLAMIILPLGSVVPDLSVHGAKVFGGSCLSAVLFSIIYYYALFPVENYEESKSSFRSFSLLRLAGVSWRIDKVDSESYQERWRKFEKTSRKFDEEINYIPYVEEQVRQFGERQMVYYKLDGDNPSMPRRFAFLFLGGSFDGVIRNPLRQLGLPGVRIELPTMRNRNPQPGQI